MIGLRSELAHACFYMDLLVRMIFTVLKDCKKKKTRRKKKNIWQRLCGPQIHTTWPFAGTVCWAPLCMIRSRGGWGAVVREVVVYLGAIQCALSTCWVVPGSLGALFHLTLNNPYSIFIPLLKHLCKVTQLSDGAEVWICLVVLIVMLWYTNTYCLWVREGSWEQAGGGYGQMYKL